MAVDSDIFVVPIYLRDALPEGKDFEVGGELSEARPEKSSADTSGQMDVSNGPVSADIPGMEYVVHICTRIILTLHL